MKRKYKGLRSGEGKGPGAKKGERAERRRRYTDCYECIRSRRGSSPRNDPEPRFIILGD